jgi:hypothetical protein
MLPVRGFVDVQGFGPAGGHCECALEILRALGGDDELKLYAKRLRRVGQRLPHRITERRDEHRDAARARNNFLQQLQSFAGNVFRSESEARDRASRMRKALDEATGDGIVNARHHDGNGG